MNESKHVGNIKWQLIQPDTRFSWLTDGLQSEFDTFIPIGTKETKAIKGKVTNVIFKTYSLGVTTNRDVWTHHFNRAVLIENISGMIDTYNAEVARWMQRKNKKVNVDDFVLSDETKISWSRGLKNHLRRGKTAEYSQHNIRKSIFRPFTKTHLYFDRMMNENTRVFPSIFPTLQTETENQVICVNVTTEKPFICFITDCIPNLGVTGGFGSPTQCFPFYTYDEDGSNRKENITDWALDAFRSHYNDNTISKWDIFHYTYALLYHPAYREKYQANLKRDLPHIPYAPDFWGFAKAGAELADIHVNYETQDPYPHLQHNETPDVPVNFEVEKMKLSKDKTELKYNNFLTITGIPPEVYEYRLGTRSALEWVIDQYRVKTDKRSGIVNDPNRADDERYIVNLIGRVITVSLRTVEIVGTLPDIV